MDAGGFFRNDRMANLAGLIDDEREAFYAEKQEEYLNTRAYRMGPNAIKKYMEAVDRARHDQWKSYRELAEGAALSQSRISQLVKKPPRDLRVSTLAKLAQSVGMEIRIELHPWPGTTDKP